MLGLSLFVRPASVPASVPAAVPHQHFEDRQTHPIAISPDGRRLLP